MVSPIGSTRDRTRKIRELIARAVRSASGHRWPRSAAHVTSSPKWAIKGLSTSPSPPTRRPSVRRTAALRRPRGTAAVAAGRTVGQPLHAGQQIALVGGDADPVLTCVEPRRKNAVRDEEESRRPAQGGGPPGHVSRPPQQLDLVERYGAASGIIRRTTPSHLPSSLTSQIGMGGTLGTVHFAVSRALRGWVAARAQPSG